MSSARGRIATRTTGRGRKIPRDGQDAILRHLLVGELEDLYDADQQLIGAFVKLSRAAHAKPVIKLCREGASYTKERVRRLNRVFETLGTKPRARRSQGMRGLIRNALSYTVTDKHAPAPDVPLIRSVQQISFYGLSGYGAACAVAAALGEKACLAILRKSLSEKRSAVSEEAEILKDLLKLG